MRGAGGTGFGRGDAAAETGEEAAAAVPGEVDGEGTGEDGGAEGQFHQAGGGVASVGDGFVDGEAVAGEGVEVAGREDGFWFHGGNDGRKQKKTQEYSLISQVDFAGGGGGVPRGRRCADG